MSEWKTVPAEPTEEMIEAAERREDDEPLSDWGKSVPAPHSEIYKAMLAAAPARPAGDVEVGERAVTDAMVEAAAKAFWEAPDNYGDERPSWESLPAMEANPEIQLGPIQAGMRGAARRALVAALAANNQSSVRGRP